MNTIIANNLEFTYLTYGKGPLLLCLHGFPDSAHTWEDLGPRLARLGYQVVAPFMRGYEPTEIPLDGSYGALDLGADVLGLIEAFEQESAVVIGHDWGALAAYTAANLNPRAISKLVTLAIPHPRSLQISPFALWRARHFVTFQFPNAARRFMRRKHMSGVDDIYRRWSPTWDFQPSETAYIRASFADPERLDAALGYYWSFRSQASESGPVMGRKTAVPTLCLVGSVDGALSFSAMDRTPDCYVNDYQYHIMPNIGHFPHREAPDVVFDYIANFLQETDQS